MQGTLERSNPLSLRSAAHRFMVILLTMALTGSAALAAPDVRSMTQDPSAPAAEWTGSVEEREQVAKAFVQRWVLWTAMTKETLRTALLEGDLEAWSSTGLDTVIDPADFEAIGRQMTPEILAAFESVEKPMELFWVYPGESTALGSECYAKKVVGELTNATLDLVEEEWQLVGSEQSLARASVVGPIEGWRGPVAEREAVKDAFARRWVFWTLATKHELRHAFEAEDWTAWRATGLTEHLSETEFASLRQALTDEHLAAFETLDPMFNGRWVPGGKCYPESRVAQLVDRTFEMVDRQWIVTD